MTRKDTSIGANGSSIGRVGGLPEGSSIASTRLLRASMALRDADAADVAEEVEEEAKYTPEVNAEAVAATSAAATAAAPSAAARAWVAPLAFGVRRLARVAPPVTPLAPVTPVARGDAGGPGGLRGAVDPTSIGGFSNRPVRPIPL